MKQYHFHRLLLSRREQLRDMNRDVDRNDVTLDQTRVGRLSRMGAMQDHEMSLDAERRRLAELKRIDLALTKIRDDDYGWCEDCGEDIAAGRLDIDPAALYCVKCAGKREQS